MRNALTAAVATALFLFAATLAGMGVFGMGTMAGMDMHHGPSTDCVEHCLASIPDAGSPTVPMLAGVVFVVLAVLLPRAEDAGAGRPSPVRQRWRDAFGRLLLRQSLATVILRN
jgi:hypothetical protein